MPESLDPFAPEHLADPYPLYARLRARPEDLVAVPERGVEIASRHAVVQRILREHHSYRSGEGVQWIPVADAGVRATFIENDPPDHTRVRRAVQKWCTPRAIAALGDVVDTVVAEHVERFVAAGGGDVMEMLARPIPTRVMSEWLGLELPPEATAWADASFQLGAPDPPPEATARFADFFTWAAGDGFAGVRADGFAATILAGGDHQALHDDEPFIALASIVIAGLDTTVQLIGNGIAAFADHPEQFEILRADPDRHAAPAVEETLRYDSPVRFFLRRTDDGRAIALLYGAANRDDAVFEDADRFLVTRGASEHLAFGAGIHLCLGAPLARLEGASLFRHLAARAGSIEVLPGAIRTASAATRGFATLPVRVGRATQASNSSSTVPTLG